MVRIKKAETSNIDIDVKVEKQPKQKQRTEKWKEQRRGRWTGSQLKNLMACSPGKSKLGWDDINRLFAFGKTSIKYIYENAMERKTGRYIDEGDGTQQMRYGTVVEPLIQKAAKKKLKKHGKLKQVGFRKFPTMPNAGVSSDSVIKKKKKVVATVEMKACTNWQTHYDRTFDLVDPTSKDFWQVQGQLLAWEVDLCYYVIAEPPSDIKKYLYYSGDIMDLYKDFCEECPITIIEVKPFKVEMHALLKRICIAENALNDWLATGGSLEEVLDKTIEFYHEHPKKLEEYIAPLPFQKEVKKSKPLKEGKTKGNVKKVKAKKEAPEPPAPRKVKKKDKKKG